MKIQSLLFSLAAFVLIDSEALAQGAETTEILGSAATKWPGVTFNVTEVHRVANDRVLMVIRVQADGSAEPETLIGVPAAKSEKDIPEDLNPSDVGNYAPTRFSLAGGSLTAKGTGVKYPSLPELPTEPYFGPNAICVNLERGGWLQLAVQFEAPPETSADPNNTDAEAKQPAVDVSLPAAERPITNITIPKMEVTEP